MVRAALWSRSSTSPQVGQTCVLTLSDFFDACATPAAILTREGWLNRYHRYAMEGTVVVHPRQKAAPGGITDTLCQTPVFHEVAYPKVFIGNQIVRCDERACLLAGKIFTLPLHLEIRFG